MRKKILYLLIVWMCSLSVTAQQSHPNGWPQTLTQDECGKCGDVIGISSYNYRANTDEIVLRVAKYTTTPAECKMDGVGGFLASGTATLYEVVNGVETIVPATSMSSSSTNPKTYNVNDTYIEFVLKGAILSLGSTKTFVVRIVSNATGNPTYYTGNLSLTRPALATSRLDFPLMTIGTPTVTSATNASLPVSLTRDPEATAFRIMFKERTGSTPSWWNCECGIYAPTLSQSFVFSGNVSPVLTGLKPGKTYDICVRDGGSQRASVYSPMQQVTIPPYTGTTTPTVTTTTPPANHVFVSKPQNDEITFAWTRTNCTEDVTLVVQRLEGNSTPKEIYNGNVGNVNTKTLTKNDFSNGGLSGQGKLQWQIKSCGIWTAWSPFCIKSCDDVPPPPTGDGIEELKIGSSETITKNVTLNENIEKRFKVKLTDFTFFVVKTTGSADRNVNIYVRKDAIASNTEYDVYSKAGALYERVRIDRSGSDGYEGNTSTIKKFDHIGSNGWYYITLRASGASDVTVSLSLRTELLQTPFAGNGWVVTQGYNAICPINSGLCSHYGDQKFAVDLDKGFCSGLTVLSLADGKIAAKGYNNYDLTVAEQCNRNTRNRTPYGNVLRVSIGDGYAFLIAHLLSFHSGIEIGGSVTKGQELGLHGKTGCAKGEHIHLELRKYPKEEDALNPSNTTMPLIYCHPIANQKERPYDFYDDAYYDQNPEKRSLNGIKPTNGIVSECPKEKSSMNVYPNPVISTVTIEYISVSENIMETELLVLSSEGKKLMSKPVSISKGYNSFEVDMSNNKQGLYFISLGGLVNKAIR